MKSSFLFEYKNKSEKEETKTMSILLMTSYPPETNLWNILPVQKKNKRF